MFANLHVHSTFSDGTDTPLQLCIIAKQHNIQVISITDHDTVSGQKALIKGGMPVGIKVIPGIEISTEVNHKMLHILGYYINIYDRRLEEFLSAISAEKTETTRLNFENACYNKVFSYKWERVLELNKGQPRISGIHVIKAMKHDKYEVPGMNLWEMFGKYFYPANENYITNQTITAYDAVNIIKAVGGISVIAHPKDINDDETVLDLIKHGLHGIEVYHPIHSEKDINKYLEIAKENSLFISGGSDWHGKNNRRGQTSFDMTGLQHGDYEILF